MSEGQLIQLPMGDLWRAPAIDPATGEQVARADTVSAKDLQNRPRPGTRDVEAILMAELQKGNTVAAPPVSE